MTAAAWPERVAQLTADLDRARSVAVAREQTVARVADVVTVWAGYGWDHPSEADSPTAAMLRDLRAALEAPDA